MEVPLEDRRLEVRIRLRLSRTCQTSPSRQDTSVTAVDSVVRRDLFSFFVNS